MDREGREVNQGYVAGYNDARADALYELRLAMRDIDEGADVRSRLKQFGENIRRKELPEGRP